MLTWYEAKWMTIPGWQGKRRQIKVSKDMLHTKPEQEKSTSLETAAVMSSMLFKNA